MVDQTYLFCEKFLENETNYSNSYNAVIHFDLYRKVGLKNRKKKHLSIKSELLIRLASLLRRLHNACAEFVD